jgi:cyclopropane-fatty-acyl-phospholipid synthase
MSTPLSEPRAEPTAEDHWIIRCCERGWLPDGLVRAGMRRLMRRRLSDESAGDVERRAEALDHLLRELRASPIAIDTQAANVQHYEVPAAFFQLHLGPRMKYSCGYYPRGDETLAQAGDAMLECYAARAGLADGQRILDLGCGWGSFAPWLAQRYPSAHSREPILAIFTDVYGDDAALWFQRWRMFYMAVAELFGYAHGSEWGVAHYLFEKRGARAER